MEDQKLYKIEFPGWYLGGVMLVFAKSESEALELAHSTTEDEGLRVHSWTTTEIPIEPGKVVYFDDGNY